MSSLGNDLATIREKLNLTLEDIQDSTKIPVHILRSIEDDSIFSEFEENNTYIRSYVRSYARVLKVDENLIRRALDQQEKGRYAGLLGKKAEDDQWKISAEEDTGGPGEQTGEPEDDEAADRPPDFSDAEGEITTPDPGDTAAEPAQKPPSVRSVDWADMGRKFQPLQTQSKYWVGILLLLLLFLASLFVFYYLQNSDSAGTANEAASGQLPGEPNAVPDSLQLDIVTPGSEDTLEVTDSAPSDVTDQTRRQATMETLPDTLSLIIYAAYDKLEPVRVYTDILGSINPYWIEQGDAFRFDFVNNIRIRGQFSRMILLFNGHLVQNIREQFYNPDTRLVEIERTFFENDPRWLQPPPDSLEVDAPPPNVIQNRPTFN